MGEVVNQAASDAYNSLKLYLTRRRAWYRLFQSSKPVWELERTFSSSGELLRFIADVREMVTKAKEGDIFWEINPSWLCIGGARPNRIPIVQCELLLKQECGMSEDLSRVGVPTVVMHRDFRKDTKMTLVAHLTCIERMGEHQCSPMISSTVTGTIYEFGGGLRSLDETHARNTVSGKHGDMVLQREFTCAYKVTAELRGELLRVSFDCIGTEGPIQLEIEEQLPYKWHLLDNVDMNFPMRIVDVVRVDLDKWHRGLSSILTELTMANIEGRLFKVYQNSRTSKRTRILNSPMLYDITPHYGQGDFVEGVM